jgi:glycosyltransferase involved in cell wall biosynthesis
MTKLFILITSLAGGGAERVASELSLHLNSNFQRRIVTLTNNISYTSNEDPISMDLKLNSKSFFLSIYEFIQGVTKYRKLIKNNKPNVSLSFLVLDNIINILSNIGNPKTKTIVSVHVSLSRKFNSHRLFPFIRVFIKILYNYADLVLAVSEGVKKEIINDFGIEEKKVKVVYNPVDINKIEKLSQEEIHDEKWFAEHIPIIINVGRLAKPKGQWHLIRSFSHVQKKVKCRLCIVGDGPLKSKLETLVHELNLSDDVKFLGWKENPFKYIHKSSLFVLSSLSEALPYALIEAMACGCPVISTDCKHGPREILNGGHTGILISPFDGRIYDSKDPLTLEEIELGDKILSLLNDKKLRIYYSSKARERSKDFSVDKIIVDYEKIISNIY